MAYDYDSDQLDPVRKIVSGEFMEDPGLLSDAVAQSVRELYYRAEGDGLRVLGCRAEFGRDPGSMYGEGIMTVAAAETRRKPLGFNAAQMDAEILRLLSIRRED